MRNANLVLHKFCQEYEECQLHISGIRVQLVFDLSDIFNDILGLFFEVGHVGDA